MKRSRPEQYNLHELASQKSLLIQILTTDDTKYDQHLLWLALYSLFTALPNSAPACFSFLFKQVEKRMGLYIVRYRHNLIELSVSKESMIQLNPCKTKYV